MAATPVVNSVSEAHGDLRELAIVAPGMLAVGVEIGKGRFKRVHRGWHRRFGAVVVLHFDGGHDANELNMLKHFAKKGGCQNVPKVLGVCGDRVVQEYALWGSLKAALGDTDVQLRLSPVHKRCVATQMARAGAFLQESRIVHADLSCRNVLLFWLEEEPKFTIAKISDFGLAAVLPESCDFIQRKQPQATRWCSPETVAHLTLSHRSDVWSMGTTLWELFANGTAPWSKRSRRSDVAARLRDLSENHGAAEGGPDVSSDFPLSRSLCGSAIVHTIILSCLQADEHARPTFTKLRQNFEHISQVAKAPESLSGGESSDESQKENHFVFSGKAPTTSMTDAVESADDTSEDCPVVRKDGARVHGSRFIKIKDFLRTPPALQALGEDAVQGMVNELEDAEAQDFSKRFQPAARTRVPSDVTTATSLPSLAGFTSAPGSSVPSSREMLSSTPSAASLNDNVVPLVWSRGKWVEGKNTSPPEPGAWTLTTYLSPALRRQDFATRQEAMAALASDKSNPSMIRGPSGAEVASRSWVPSQLKG